MFLAIGGNLKQLGIRKQCMLPRHVEGLIAPMQIAFHLLRRQRKTNFDS